VVLKLLGSGCLRLLWKKELVWKTLLSSNRGDLIR